MRTFATSKGLWSPQADALITLLTGGGANLYTAMPVVDPVTGLFSAGTLAADGLANAPTAGLAKTDDAQGRQQTHGNVQTFVAAGSIPQTIVGAAWTDGAALLQYAVTFDRPLQIRPNGQPASIALRLFNVMGGSPGEPVSDLSAVSILQAGP
jgi:hypothetical protein